MNVENAVDTGDTTTAARAATASDTANAVNHVLATGRVLRRHLVTAMGVSARMGAEQ